MALDIREEMPTIPDDEVELPRLESVGTMPSADYSVSESEPPTPQPPVPDLDTTPDGEDAEAATVLFDRSDIDAMLTDEEAAGVIGEAATPPPAPAVPRNDAAPAEPPAAAADSVEIEVASPMPDDGDAVVFTTDASDGEVEIAPADVGQLPAEQPAHEPETAPYDDDGAIVDDGEAEFGEVDFEPAHATDAVMALMQSGQRDAWIARASWFYDEAPEADQPADRARALLVAAEMLAMCGEDRRAEQIAHEAVGLTPSCPMARRQLRAMTTARRAWPEVLELLDQETKIAPTPAAQAHAASLGATVARLGLGDVDGASQRLALTEHALADDMRPVLFRLAHGLATTDEGPTVKLSDAPAMAPIAEACAQITATRSNGAQHAPTTTPFTSLLTARAALHRRDVAQLVGSLEQLAEDEELSPGASWLTSVLAAPHRDLREQAVAALGRLTEGSHGAIAVRTRAVRALEVGNSAAAVEVANSAGEDVLSAADRLVIASLTGTPLNRLGAWLEEASESAEYGALAAASSAVLSDVRDSERLLTNVGGPEVRTTVTLGRQLAAQSGHHPLESSESSVAGRLRETADARLREAAQDVADTEPSNGAARAVLLEVAHSSGSVPEVSAGLLADRDPDGPLGRERALASAMFAELSDDQESFREQLEQARAAMPGDVATLRISLEVGEPHEAARELAAYAEAAGEPTTAAVALTEAALRYVAAGDRVDAEPLLRRAAELFPELPIAGFLGLQLAQEADDVDAQRAWLQLRRSAAIEPQDQALDLIREAVRVPAEEGAERAALLTEACRARPDEFAVRLLLEQAAGELPPDHAEWLMSQAAAHPADAASMALEAALTYEFDGDVERASECGRAAREAGDETLAPIVARRYALRGHGADETVTELVGQYEGVEDPVERRELCELLANIELEGRDEPARAIGWLRTILGEDPQHLPTLRKLERLLVGGEDPELLEAVALQTAAALDGPEALAHAMLATRLMEATGRWPETLEALQRAAEVAPSDLWTLRQLIGHTSAEANQALAAEACSALNEHATDPMEQATLQLRAAEARLALGDDQHAGELLDQALELWPDHYMVRLQRAYLLERTSGAADAAAAFEQLAMVSQAPAERAASLYRAATLWLSLDEQAGQDEGRRLLEAVAAIDPDYEDTFDRLKAIYLASGAKNELADLLDARLQRVTEPEQRIELEVLRGRVLAEAGAAAEARAALEAAIQASPDNPEALWAYADVCTAEQDWSAVEQTLIQLGRLVAEPEGQADIYLRLGDLYSDYLPNPERAELSYQEVLKRAPDHRAARAKLVDLYLQGGDVAQAFEQQKALIDSSGTPKEQCEHVVRLAEIYEAAGDAKQAEATLVKARRTFAKETSAMMALYQFYQRNGQEPAADKLLERASAEVRRGLGAGRFEPALFGMVAAVAELRGQSETAEIAAATLAAIEGEVTLLEGFGTQAADEQLDPYMAPDVFSDAFRYLLKSTGLLLELAVPLDPNSVRGKPLGPQHAEVGELAMELAGPYGVPDLQVFGSSSLGPVCLPAYADGPALVFGVPLLESDQFEPREFLIHRGLKLLQTRTAALSRTAPIDLWPLMAAYLKLHSPSFTPQGVDQRRFDQYLAAMSPQAPPADPRTSAAAGEILKAIGNRASSLNAVAASWGSRAGLLAVGSPYVALLGVAWALGSGQGPPAAGPDRMKWISRKAEARDLIVFSVSDEYAQARLALQGG